MSKRDAILFLFKWKYSLIGYFLFVVATVSVLVYLLPQKYNAMSSILVESNRAPVMRSDTEFGSDELTVVNSAVAVIKSKTVLSSAVDKVGIEEDDEPASTIGLLLDSLLAWMQEVGLSEPTTPRDALISNLEKRLDVEPLASSNVITISLSGKNSKRTAEMINAVTDSYIAHHLKIFSSSGTSEVYRLQVERLARKLEQRRKELAEYKTRSSVSALAETRHALVQSESELVSELAAEREELAELLTRFSPGHTKITLADKKVAAIRDSLARTRSRLQKMEVEGAALEGIKLDINSIEKSYQAYQNRYEQERLNDLANPEVVNVRVIEYASVPMRPGHSRIFYIALATIGGFILSLGIALIREYFDHRVSDPDTASRLLGIPVLGSIERARTLF